jgi:hypothetical protein
MAAGDKKGDAAQGVVTRENLIGQAVLSLKDFEDGGGEIDNGYGFAFEKVLSLNGRFAGHVCGNLQVVWPDPAVAAASVEKNDKASKGAGCTLA